MQNSNKYKAVLNYVLGPILFIVLSFFIYKSLTDKQDIGASWKHLLEIFKVRWWWLLGLIILMVLNWTLEARKWQLLVRPVERVSLFTGLRAVMSGLSFSLFIPNGLGEYLGRMLYLHEGKRLRSVIVSVVGSISQVIVTFVMGLIGTLLILHYGMKEGFLPMNQISQLWVKGLLYFVITATILLLLFYFKISWFARWLEKIPFIHKHRIFILSLESYGGKLLGEVLLFAFIRYLVFIVQYLLVFHMLDVNISFSHACAAIAAMFLIMTLIPTIPVAEVSVRGEISLQLFGLLSSNHLGIVSSAILIWIINIIIPSILGSFFILGVKIFRNK